MKIHFNQIQVIVNIFLVLVLLPLDAFSNSANNKYASHCNKAFYFNSSKLIKVNSLLKFEKTNNTDTISKKKSNTENATCTPTNTNYTLLNLVGAEKISTRIKKKSETLAGWKNAGGSTNLVLSEGDYFTYKVLQNKRVTVGLSALDKNCNLQTIENGLNTHSTGIIRIFENGNVMYSGRSYNTNTVFKVLIENNRVKYFLNAETTPFYTRSTDLPLNRLVVDFSLYDIDSEIIDLKVFKCCLEGDADTDGVCNSDDLCYGQPDGTDTNQNGIPDGCELTTSFKEIPFNLRNGSTGVTVIDGSTLTKKKIEKTGTTNIWNSGGSLDVKISDGQYIEYKVKMKDPNITTPPSIALGLSKALRSGVNFGTIETFIYTKFDNIFYCNYVNTTDDSQLKNYNVNTVDVFKILFTDGIVKFFHNNEYVYYVKGIYQKTDLLNIDFSMFEKGSQIIDLQLFEPCTADTIILTSALGTTSQTICSNTPIGDIVYAAMGATNVSISSGSLPQGVSSIFTNGVFSISGTPTAAATGTYNYTISTSGGCGTATTNGTITVTAPVSAGVLNGIEEIAPNETTTFTSTIVGGTWTSSSVAVATIDSVSGLITPVSEGSTVMTYRVMGTGGCNDATATRTLTVRPVTTNDTIPPTIISCASSQSIPANDDCEAVVPNFTNSISATDNISPPNLIITQSPTAGTTVSMGVTNVVITVTDAANNTSTCTTTFTTD